MKVKPITASRDAAIVTTRRVFVGENWPSAGVGIGPPYLRFCAYFVTNFLTSGLYRKGRWVWHRIAETNVYNPLCPADL
jgi:hypothetical protein